MMIVTMIAMVIEIMMMIAMVLEIMMMIAMVIEIMMMMAISSASVRQGDAWKGLKCLAPLN